MQTFLSSAAKREDLRSKKFEMQVHLLIGITDAQLHMLYNAAMAFVYPSQYEGFGIPLLQAMACGCPIVALDISSSREVTKDYPDLFLFYEERIRSKLY